MKLSSCLFFLVVLCILSTDNAIAPKKIRRKRITFNTRTILCSLPQALKIIEDLRSLWGILLRDPHLDIASAIFRSKEEEMKQSFLEISSEISNLEQQAGNSAESIILTILQAFPKIIKLEINFHDLRLILNQINFAEEQMRNYLIHGYQNTTTEGKHTERNRTLDFPALEYIMSNSINKRDATDNESLTEKFTLLDFATWATGHSFYSLMSLLRRMNDLVTGQSENLFTQIKEVSQIWEEINHGERISRKKNWNVSAEKKKNSSLRRKLNDSNHSAEMTGNVCNLRQSPFQTLYNLYNTIAVAELKGNTILQFSYMILKMYNKGNFTMEADIALQEYEKHSKKKLEVIRNTLPDVDRAIYKCDPKQFVEGVSYTKLTKLLQGYIENEVNLNHNGGCWENCQYYKYTEYNGCYMNQFCAHQPRCSGKVIACGFVDSDMDICTSSNPERRYEWVQYENGKTLGTKGACQKKNLFKVDSWWRYLFWHCSYCLCLCDDSSEQSDRYFNLRQVTSDIEKNKVVTGVRIVKQNKIIHLQIQQGVLTPLGVVNKTSLSWKPVDNYTIDDNNVYNNVDYHTMSWLERALDIDDVSGPPEHVVTGLRFRKIGAHLNLEIRVTPINFTSGNVMTAQHSYWLGNDNTNGNVNNPRTEITLNNPDIPIRNGPHSLNSKHDQYIQFQATSVDKDAAQSTVPYLDSQPLTSQGFILSGVGLIHRGKPGSGGFIAPKLISYDFLPHLKFNKFD